MTNLEFYKDELMKMRLSADRFAYELSDFIDEHKGNVNTVCDCIEWLCKEYKEPIKLKQWEYDLIETNDQPHNRYFNSFMTYRNMKDKGYFKGVYDTNMTLAEILENCEVEDVDS